MVWGSLCRLGNFLNDLLSTTTKILRSNNGYQVRCHVRAISSFFAGFPRKEYAWAR